MDSAGLLATTMQPLVVGEAGSYYEWKSSEFPILSQAKLGAGLLTIQPSVFALPHYTDASKIGYVIRGLSEEETTKVTQSQTEALILKVDGHDMPEPSTIGIKHLVYNAEVAEPNTSVKDGGTLVVVTGEELDVLKEEGLSGAVVKLHKNAMYAPRFSSDSAFRVNYIVKGSGRVQIAGLNGQNVLDETVKAGDLFVVPRFFMVAVIADGEGMEWFSLVPIEKPVFGELVGETSVLKALSPRVLQIALNITPELENQFRSKMKATPRIKLGGWP